LSDEATAGYFGYKWLQSLQTITGRTRDMSFATTLLSVTILHPEGEGEMFL
jgi:hypothetical protein